MNRIKKSLRERLGSYRTRYSRPALLFYAALGLGLAALMSYIWLFSDGVPARDALVVAKGQVAWLQEDTRRVRFTFIGDDRRFQYLSKANASDRVAEALRRTDRPVFTVRYQDRNQDGKRYPPNAYRVVYEVATEDQMIRSHAEVASAWAADDALAPWLAGISLGLSGFLLLAALYNPD